MGQRPQLGAGGKNTRAQLRRRESLEVRLEGAVKIFYGGSDVSRAVLER